MKSGLFCPELLLPSASVLSAGDRTGILTNCMFPAMLRPSISFTADDIRAETVHELRQSSSRQLLPTCEAKQCLENDQMHIRLSVHAT